MRFMNSWSSCTSDHPTEEMDLHLFPSERVRHEPASHSHGSRTHSPWPYTPVRTTLRHWAFPSQSSWTWRSARRPALETLPPRLLFFWVSCHASEMALHRSCKDSEKPRYRWRCTTAYAVLEKCPFPLQSLMRLHINIIVKISTSLTHPQHPQHQLGTALKGKRLLDTC